MSGSWDGFHAKKEATGHVLRWPDELVVRVAHRWKRSLKGKRVLDLQCGGGRHTALLANLGFDVISLDLSQVALGLARRALVEQGIAGKLVAGSTLQLPFGKGSFDGLVAWRALHVFTREEQSQVIEQMSRILRPGGRVLLSTRSDRNRYDETTVGKTLPTPTDLTLSELESLCNPLEVLEIEHTETTARNRALCDAYWVVHASSPFRGC